MLEDCCGRRRWSGTLVELLHCCKDARRSNRCRSTTGLFLLKHFLLLQQRGTIYCAAFTDDTLFSEMAHKAIFWQQNSFFGVDLSSLYAPALEGYFSQV